MNHLEKDLLLTTQILEKSQEIIKFLQIGTNIPIWPEFHKYILFDLNHFRAKSIILMEDKNPIGHVLFYDDGRDVLFFGFFKIIDDDEIKIQFLINKLVEIADKNDFKFVRGPINIPTIIYGWGFMKEGSKANLFIGKPVNPPIYQKLFLKLGFIIKTEEDTWEGPYFRMNPWKIKKYDFHEYEYFVPKDWKELLELKEEFFHINDRNLPLTSRLTPQIQDLFENYAEFVMKYGSNYMFSFVRHIPTNKIIATICGLPNPFRKDEKGNYDTTVILSWAVDPQHRKKGIGTLMIGAMTLQAWKIKMRYASGPMNQVSIISGKLANKFGVKKMRTHLILEYEKKTT